MRYLANKLCALTGIYPTKMTKDDDLKSLLRRLRPVLPGKDLIRLGPNGDGGYLVPDDLEGIAACFSPGVDYVSGFEKDCARRGMLVYMADNSVEGPAEDHELFHFTKKYIGVTTNNNFITLDDWVATSLPGSQDDLMLQIDIEGSEYEVFLGVSDELLQRFRIIVAEVHSLKNLWSEPFFKIVSRSFEKLLQTHTCVHNHPNNISNSKKIGDIEIPKTLEMTFLRNDRIVSSSFADTFPHPLDFDNSDKPPLHLPKCWYKD